MKKVLFVCCISILGFLACEKEELLPSEGKITGLDHRKCGCCGGWFIEIESSTYRFYESPIISELDLMNETFPVFVRLAWSKDETGCGIDLIKIGAIMKE
ncbi:MAG: hypothetical protein HQ522_18385 [Bacteroidetes bacterium]|nr:hypothetical protein [Bacteroidota bacterium]